MMGNFKSVFPWELEINSSLFIANWIMWFPSPDAVVLAFANSFNIPAPKYDYYHSISRYTEFFSYFWLDDDKRLKKEGFSLCCQSSSRTAFVSAFGAVLSYFINA